MFLYDDLRELLADRGIDHSIFNDVIHPKYEAFSIPTDGDVTKVSAIKREDIYKFYLAERDSSIRQEEFRRQRGVKMSFSKMLTPLGLEQKKIEELVSLFAAKTSIDIVVDDNIDRNYVRDAPGSCMTGTDYIYWYKAIFGDKIQSVRYELNGDIRSRALLWNAKLILSKSVQLKSLSTLREAELPETFAHNADELVAFDVFFLDRVYSKNTTYTMEVLRKARELGWVYKNDQSFSHRFTFMHNGNEIADTGSALVMCEFDKNTDGFDGSPYVDTLYAVHQDRFITSSAAFADRYMKGKFITYLQATSGVTEDGDILSITRCGDEILIDTVVKGYLCSHCGREIDDDDEYYDTSGSPLCDACFYNNYFYCSGCGEVEHICDSVVIDDRDYCERCAQRMDYATCYECERNTTEYESVYIASEDEYRDYCSNCTPNTSGCVSVGCCDGDCESCKYNESEEENEEAC